MKPESNSQRPAGADHAQLYKTHGEQVPVKYDVTAGGTGRTYTPRMQNKVNQG